MKIMKILYYENMALYGIQNKTCKNTQNHPTFITTYDPSIHLKDILQEDWPRLSSDSNLRKHFQLPPQITYKHSPNLSQLLVRAKLNHPVNTDIPIHPAPTISLTSFPAKSIKCRNEQCGTCNQLSEKAITAVIKLNITFLYLRSSPATPPTPFIF